MPSEGQEKFQPDYEYKLGTLFKKNKAEYLRFASVLLLRKIPPILESDRTELAKDLVQNAFLYLLKNQNINFNYQDTEIHNYVIECIKGEVSRWIKKFYRSDAKNPFKIPERDYVPLEEAKDTTDTSSNSNPQTSIEKQELGNKLDEVLRTLSPREEKILRMHYGLFPFEKGYSNDEIAETFGVSEERIKLILARVRRKMREPRRSEKLKDVYREE